MSGKGDSDDNLPFADIKIDDENAENESPDEEPVPTAPRSRIPLPINPATSLPTILNTPATPTAFGPSSESRVLKELPGARLTAPNKRYKNDDSGFALEDGKPETFSEPDLLPAPLFAKKPLAAAPSDTTSDSGASGKPDHPPFFTDIPEQDSASSFPPSEASSPGHRQGPGVAHPWFNPAKTGDRDLLYPEPTYLAEKMATMGSIAENGVRFLRPLRSVRYEREQALLAEEFARRTPEPREQEPVTFNAPEISAFLEYAEEHADEEWAKQGLEAMKAAMHTKHGRMVEFVQLKNANKELSEKIAMLQKENDALREMAGNDAASIEYYRKEILKKDSEAEVLKAQKGDMVDMAQYTALNAEKNRNLQDRIGELELEIEGLRMDPRAGGLLTEEQGDARHAIEQAHMGARNKILVPEVNEVKEALTLAQHANSTDPNVPAPEDRRPLRQQIAELGEEVQKCKAEVASQKIDAYGIVTMDLEDYEKVKAENEELRKSVDAKDELLATQETIIGELNEDSQTLKARLANSTDALKLSSLEESNNTLRQTNSELRDELVTNKRKLKDLREDRDKAKNELRKLDGVTPGLLGSPSIKLENPEVVTLKEENTGLKRRIVGYLEKLEDFKARYATDMADANAEIKYRDEIILRNKEHSDEMKIELEEKIKALEAAKADTERQIKRQKRKIAELEGGDLDTYAEGSEPSPTGYADSSDKNSLPSDGAMEVALLRCEISLGLLQAERKRTGFTEGDAMTVISIAQEAQGLAERLNSSAWIGRAAFWRGIAEWMGGNTTASEAFFETSANNIWTETADERSMLQEWWDTSKNKHVDKSSRNGPDGNALGRTSWSARSKNNKSKKDKSDGKKSKDKKGKKHVKEKKAETQTQTQVPSQQVHEEVPTRVEVRPEPLINYATLKETRVNGQPPDPVQENRVDTKYVEAVRGTWVDNLAAKSEPTPAEQANDWLERKKCCTQ